MGGVRRELRPHVRDVNLRVGMAALAARASGAFSRALRRGGGTALPGLVAEALAPDLLTHLAGQLPGGVVVVTGTNGKTTTSHMLARILTHAGMRPLRNASGSNLSRGVAATLAGCADWAGRLRGRGRGEVALTGADHRGYQGGHDVGLFETDEAAFARVVPAVRPTVVVVTNLFRDQLDRYGEVDSVASLWRGALDDLAAARFSHGDRKGKSRRTGRGMWGDGGGDGQPPVTLALNADDPMVASLASAGRGLARTLYFGVDDTRWGHPGPDHAADAKVCPNCGARLEHLVCFYGHLGHYRCPNGHGRPAPAVSAQRVEPRGFDGSEVTLATSEGELTLFLPVPGLYNVYNALAAVTAALALGVPLEAVRQGLATFSAAFGRLERVQIGDGTLYLVLAKNPVGMNEALRTILIAGAAGERRHLFLALNDMDADGRDVSWIWDADFELLAGHVVDLTISGRRVDDLAVRLKYAGVIEQLGSTVIEPDLTVALDRALARLPAGETLYGVLTYTAMLALRRLLTQRGHLRAYWEA